MSKFLDLIESLDPRNSENPKWKLIDFLKSKGIKVSLVRGTDMLYIDTDEDTIAVNVSIPEEEAESMSSSSGQYNVDHEVEGLADKANSGLTGLAARAMGTSAQKAKSAVKKRQNLAKQAVDVYDKGTQKLEKSIQNLRRSTTGGQY
jgi:dihydroxyacetone kinase DhaKLM complex PTS-EIIA-like component DhaM